MENISIDQWMAKKETDEILEKGKQWLQLFRNEIQKEYQKMLGNCYRIQCHELIPKIRRYKKLLRGEDLTIHTSPEKIYQFKQEYAKRCQRLIDHYYQPLLLWKERLERYGSFTLIG